MIIYSSIKYFLWYATKILSVVSVALQKKHWLFSFWGPCYQQNQFKNTPMPHSKKVVGSIPKADQYSKFYPLHDFELGYTFVVSACPSLATLNYLRFPLTVQRHAQFGESKLQPCEWTWDWMSVCLFALWLTGHFQSVMYLQVFLILHKVSQYYHEERLINGI